MVGNKNIAHNSIYETAILVLTLSTSLLLEFYVRYFDMWTRWPHIDTAMHFLWGINLFLIFIWLFRLKHTDALFAVFVFHIFWEVIEMIGDRIIPQKPYLIDHLFFDGIKDTIVGITGSILAWLIFTKQEFKLDYDHKYLLLRIFFVLTIPLLLIGSYVFLVTGESPDLFAVVWIVVSIPLTVVSALMVRKKL